MKLRNFDFNFELKYKELKYLGDNDVADVFEVLPTGTTLPEKLSDVIRERLLTFGYKVPDDIKLEIIVCHQTGDTKGYVVLIVQGMPDPIFIKNDFKYNEETLEQDVYKVFLDWMNLYIVENRLYNQLKRLSKTYKNISVNENDDEIKITINK
jgi:hypothetical protein